MEKVQKEIVLATTGVVRWLEDEMLHIIVASEGKVFNYTVYDTNDEFSEVDGGEFTGSAKEAIEFFT